MDSCIISHKKDMDYLNKLSNESLLKFLQNLEPEQLQNFCEESERIREICKDDDICKKLLLKGFVEKIIQKYSPLKSYLWNSAYKYSIENVLKDILKFSGPSNEVLNEFYLVLWENLYGFYCTREHQEKILKNSGDWEKLEKDITKWRKTYQ